MLAAADEWDKERTNPLASSRDEDATQFRQLPNQTTHPGCGTATTLKDTCEGTAAPEDVARRRSRWHCPRGGGGGHFQRKGNYAVRKSAARANLSEPERIMETLDV